MEGHVQLKAVSPDNERDLRDICSLYSATYGDCFPVKSVYQLEFWRNHIGRRFTSIAAFQGDLMLAHLVLSPDPHDSRHVQVCYPVCSLSVDFDQVRDSYRSLLAGLTRTRGWSLASLSIFTKVPGMEDFSGVLPAGCPTAILPCYPAAEDCSPVTDLLFACDRGPAEASARHVAIAISPLGPSSRRAGTVYLPSSHARMAALILNQFALVCAAQDESDCAQEIVKEAVNSEALREFYPFSGVCHQFVRPSAVASVSGLLREISAPIVRVPYLYVDARDPHCPAFCDALEQEGFAFCGMVPALRGTDHAVYCRCADAQALEPAVFELPQARLLCEYIKATGAEQITPAGEERLLA